MENRALTPPTHTHTSLPPPPHPHTVRQNGYETSRWETPFLQLHVPNSSTRKRTGCDANSFAASLGLPHHALSDSRVTSRDAVGPGLLLLDANAGKEGSFNCIIGIREKKAKTHALMVIHKNRIVFFCTAQWQPRIQDLVLLTLSTHPFSSLSIAFLHRT